MSYLELLHTTPALFIFSAALLGLMVGSFLNVVIHRLPIMLHREWQAQCQEILAGEHEAPKTTTPVAHKTLNLITPSSHCPHCQHPIKPWQNLPIISYLWLKGRCAQCHSKISPRYPAVEALTGLLSGIVAWHFGFGWPASAALLLTWALIALSFIDLDHFLLPDSITLPFLWLGLLLSVFGVFCNSTVSIIGALAGYLSLWSIYWLFKFTTGKEGMGYGDFKLLAMLGAWLGWQALPAIILLSSVVGAVLGIAMIALRGRDKNIPIPFGPYLAIAGWITLLWGENLKQAYLAALGI